MHYSISHESTDKAKLLTATLFLGPRDIISSPICITCHRLPGRAKRLRLEFRRQSTRFQGIQRIYSNSIAIGKTPSLNAPTSLLNSLAFQADQAADDEGEGPAEGDEEAAVDLEVGYRVAFRQDAAQRDAGYRRRQAEA
jgi:hypothetical protein